MNVSFKESVAGGTKLAMVPFKLVCVECRGVGMACPRCETCEERGRRRRERRARRARERVRETGGRASSAAATASG